MSTSRTAGKITASRSRELQVAAAVAREAVLQLHTERALELIQHAGARVAPMRMLDIYIRLLGLTGAPAEVVANRVLASLGRRDDDDDAAAAIAELNDDDSAAPPSLLRTLRGRLRGRVHDTLRRAVELHIGATQAALLHLHVEHAHSMALRLADSHAIEDACSIYTELVHVPAAVRPVLYILVLDRIAAQETTADWRVTPVAPALQHAARAPDVTTRVAPRQHRARRPA